MDSREISQEARQNIFLRRKPLETLLFGIILTALGIADIAYGLLRTSMTSANWAAAGGFVSLGASSIIRYLESRTSCESQLKPLASYGRLASLLMFGGFVILFVWLRVSQ